MNLKKCIVDNSHGPHYDKLSHCFCYAKKEPQKYYNNLTDKVEKENDNYPKVN
jgi:hypothetical protein